MTAISFIGFGEVGQTFAKDLLKRNGVRIAAYDLKFDEPGGQDANKAIAQAMGVRAATSAADASREARVVISAVTAAATLQVAREAAGYLAPGQLYLDVNSASPRTKQMAAKVVESAGAKYVEGAVMAAVAGPGLKVPILAGGPSASFAAGLLNALGMSLTPLSTEHGRASATKLARSVVMKGLEAVLLESRAAARHWDVESEVLASLRETYPGIDWAQLADRCAERVAKHGLRRAQEMREAGDMLNEMGRDPELCRAIAAFQERTARGGP
jgi:3-hydroxyisobutyrate dehydrogenase-like beta-hydroxyacid dehydrogenase